MNEFTIEGTLHELADPVSGMTGDRNWSRREFVIKLDTSGQWDNFAAFTLWNERTQLIDSFQLGMRIAVVFSLNARKSADRWFNDLRVQRIEAAGQPMAGYAGQQPPMYGQPMAGYAGQQPPMYGQPMPGYMGQQPPMYGQPVPGYMGQQPGGYGNSPMPNYGQQQGGAGGGQFVQQPGPSIPPPTASRPAMPNAEDADGGSSGDELPF